MKERYNLLVIKYVALLDNLYAFILAMYENLLVNLKAVSQKNAYLHKNDVDRILNFKIRIPMSFNHNE